jgi:peptidoglycan/LPS O-acetylase OafA/YrhL
VKLSGLPEVAIPACGVAPRRIPELDGIRGIAIILVIGCHYEVFARQFWGLPKFGWLGVDIFFVLSGFLITSVLLNLRGRADSFSTFYSRRFRRILPPYILMLVVMGLASAFMSDYDLFSADQIVRNLFFWQSVHFTSFPVFSFGTWHHTALHDSPRGLTGSISAARFVLWSLSVEEYFYLLWAPVMLCLNRKWLVVTGITICLTALVFRCFFFIGSSPCESLFHRFDALIYGAFVALLVSSQASRKLLQAIFATTGCVGFVMMAAVLLSMPFVMNKNIREDHPFVVFGLLALSLMSACVVGLSVMHSGSKPLSFLRWSPLRFIGTISYSLYLSHGLVYLCFLQFCQPTWTMALGALVLSIGLSWLSFRYIETPLLAGRRVESLLTAHELAPALGKLTASS